MSRGFRDLRSDAELLASSRPPKEVKVRTQNLLNGKLLGAVQRTKGLLAKLKTAVSTAATAATAVSTGGTSLLAQQIGNYALKGAAKKIFAEAARRTQAALEGKVGRAAGALGRGGVGSVSKLASGIGLGASIIEETDIRKLRRPFPEGVSINPAQAAKQLSETAAKTALAGLLSAPLGKGVPSLTTVFRTKVEIEASKRFWDIRKADLGALGTTTAPDPAASVQSTRSPSALLNQHGLLQDEIFYRLVLIAENIYDPLAAYAQQQQWGTPRILEGFRSENGGTSPHERGEAIDITLGDGSLAQAPRLFRLAQWAKAQLVFDQLILCHSLVPVGTGQAWLHITFSPESRRRLVLTKAFNDEFVNGLVVYEPYAPGAESVALATAAQDAALASRYIDRLATRNQELTPIGVNTVEGFTGDYGPGGEECWSLVDPWGQKYNPDAIRSTYYGAVKSAFDAAVADRPDLFEEVKTTGFRANMGPHREFLATVVQNVGDSNVGIVGIRGNSNDASGDAIAILDPTGGPQGQNTDKWDSNRRLCVIDIIAGAGSENASFGWIDHTCPGADNSINPVFIAA